jgi:hypothetical protein
MSMANGRLETPKAFETLRRVMTEIGWASEPDEDNLAFYVDFGPPHLPVSDAIAAVASDTRRFLFYVNVGPLAPPERRDEVARFITLANWGLSIGNLEMDYEEGHVRFKSSLAYGDLDLSEGLIRVAILSLMNVVEAYADLLIEVMSGRKSAVQAIKEADGK